MGSRFGELAGLDISEEKLTNDGEMFGKGIRVGGCGYFRGGSIKLQIRMEKGKRQ